MKTFAGLLALPMIFIINPQLKISRKLAEENSRNRPDLIAVLSPLRSR